MPAPWCPHWPVQTVPSDYGLGSFIPRCVNTVFTSCQNTHLTFLGSLVCLQQTAHAIKFYHQIKDSREMRGVKRGIKKRQRKLSPLFLCGHWCRRSYSSGAQSLQHFTSHTSLSYFSIYVLDCLLFISFLWQVTSWLKKIFGDYCPQYEVNARTVDILYELAEFHEARDSDVSLLVEDKKEWAAEYQAKGEFEAPVLSAIKVSFPSRPWRLSLLKSYEWGCICIKNDWNKLSLCYGAAFITVHPLLPFQQNLVWLKVGQEQFFKLFWAGCKYGQADYLLKPPGLLSWVAQHWNIGWVGREATLQPT